MANLPLYAFYQVYFRDEAEYDAVRAVYGISLIRIAPNVFAAQLGITVPIPFPAPTDGVKGIHFSEFYFPGKEVAPGIFLDADILSVFIPATDPFPANDITLIWAATLMYIGSEAGANPAPPVPIPQKRWATGFELAVTGEGGTGLSPARCGCRDASRTVDGLGWAFRNETAGITFTHSLDEYQTGFTSRESWERIYIRIRTLPSVNTQIWRSVGATSGLAGIRLVINTDGSLSIINVNAAGATTATDSSLPVLQNTWLKIDLIFRYNDGTNNGGAILFNSGTIIADLAVVIGLGGLGQAQFHASSVLGDVAGGGSNGLAVDLDDWINSDLPIAIGTELDDANSLDWLTGTHCRKVNVDIAGAGHLGWSPAQVISFNQMVSPLASSTTSRYTSSTALARLHGITDVTNDIDDLTGFNMGAIAAVIGLYASRNGVANGQLGYSIAGTVTLATIVQNVATIFNSRMYRPASMPLPVDIVPFGVAHDKANSVDSSLVLGLQAVINYVGVWGPEDTIDYVPYNIVNITHNAYYPNTPWAISGPPPIAPAGAFGGTYVGNGTFQTILLPLPVHFLWIRPLTGGNGGVKWHAAGLGGHLGGTDRVVPDYVVRCFVDSVGQPQFIVTSNDPQVNQSAVVYQYIAYMDPALRFNICGAFRNTVSAATGIVPLIDIAFTPEFMWTQSDNLNQVGSTVFSAVKGPGDAVNAGVELDGTALANYATFALGQFTARASLNINTSQINYSAWRTVDGTGEVPVQIVTYIGNGIASRVIPLTPVSGRFPLFAYVQPVAAQGFFRDPSHVGTASSSFDLFTSSATAITAGGVDSITVGITLNTNLVVYNVFVLTGDDTGWNNGDFPIPSDEPPNGVWPEIPVDPPVGLTIIPDGGIILDGSPSLLLLASISGIYTLIENKRNDTLIDRQPGQPEIDVKIPNPVWKTGYIGG